MTTAEVVDRAGRLLADAAPRQSKVILFGSQGRGDAGADSDFDSAAQEAKTADNTLSVKLGVPVNP